MKTRSAWNLSFKVWVYTVLSVLCKVSTHYLYKNSSKGKMWLWNVLPRGQKEKKLLLNPVRHQAVASELSSIQVKRQDHVRRGCCLPDWALHKSGSKSGNVINGITSKFKKQSTFQPKMTSCSPLQKVPLYLSWLQVPEHDPTNSDFPEQLSIED